MANRDPSAAPIMRMMVPAAEPADAVGFSVETMVLGVTRGYH